MQWLLLQQEEPEDFAIANGVQYSVRELVSAAAKELCMQIRWEGQDIDEKGFLLDPTWYHCAPLMHHSDIDAFDRTGLTYAQLKSCA